MEDGKRMTATIGIKNNIIRYKDKETIFYVDKNQDILGVLFCLTGIDFPKIFLLKIKI